MRRPSATSIANARATPDPLTCMMKKPRSATMTVGRTQVSGSVRFMDNEMIARGRRAWAEPLTWVLPTVIVGLLGYLLAQVTGSELVLAVTLLVALFLLIAMFLLAIIRPPTYEGMLHRLGIFKSARPNDMVVAGLGRTFQNIRLFKTMTAAENVMVGMHSRLHATPLDAALRLPRHRREEKEAEKQAPRRPSLSRPGSRSSGRTTSTPTTATSTRSRA